jgi:hypothetical protein
MKSKSVFISGQKHKDPFVGSLTAMKSKTVQQDPEPVNLVGGGFLGKEGNQFFLPKHFEKQSSF